MKQSAHLTKRISVKLALCLVLAAGAASLLVLKQRPRTVAPPGEVRGASINPATNERGASLPAQASAPAVDSPDTSNQPSKPLVRTSDGYGQLSFETLSGFRYEVRFDEASSNAARRVWVSDDTIPPSVKALDGERVAVDGFVLPLRTQRRGVTEFLLVRDQASCCYGSEPKMNHWIHVQMPRGLFRPSLSMAVTVYGTLHVGEQRDDRGSLVSVYQMDAERVAQTN